MLFRLEQLADGLEVAAELAVAGQVGGHLPGAVPDDGRGRPTAHPARISSL